MKQFIVIFSILAISLLASQSFAWKGAPSDLRLLVELRNRAVVEVVYRNQLRENGIPLKPLPVQHMTEASRQFGLDLKLDVQVAVNGLVTLAKIKAQEKNRPTSELVNEVLRTIDDATLEILIKKAGEKIESLSQQKAAQLKMNRASVYLAGIENKNDGKLIGKWSGLNRE